MLKKTDAEINLVAVSDGQHDKVVLRTGTAYSIFINKTLCYAM